MNSTDAKEYSLRQGKATPRTLLGNTFSATNPEGAIINETENTLNVESLNEFVN